MILQLHGIGSNKDDLFSFAGQLPPEYLVVSAQAPIPYYGGWAWYNLYPAMDGNFTSNLEEAKDSVNKIIAFIKEAIEAYSTQEKVILMGFSQGCISSYAVANKAPELVKSIVGMSGYFNEEIVPFDRKALQHIPIFATHGSEDAVIPIEKAKETYRVFEQADLAFHFTSYPMPHGVSPECLRDVIGFLKV